MKNILALIFVSIVCVSVHAQDTQQPLRDKFTRETTHTSSQPVIKPQGFFTPFKAGFALSTAVCAVGAARDISTSLGGTELNPLLRNDRGQLNVGRAILIKGMSCAWPALIERKHPHMAFWIRIASGAAWSVVAMRN